MAPVAPHRAYGKQNRPMQPLCLRKRGQAPLLPVYEVSLVRPGREPEIRRQRCLVDEDKDGQNNCCEFSHILFYRKMSQDAFRH
jgi:hypothetical protein